MSSNRSTDSSKTHTSNSPSKIGGSNNDSLKKPSSASSNSGTQNNKAVQSSSTPLSTPNTPTSTHNSPSQSPKTTSPKLKKSIRWTLIGIVVLIILMLGLYIWQTKSWQSVFPTTAMQNDDDFRKQLDLIKQQLQEQSQKNSDQILLTVENIGRLQDQQDQKMQLLNAQIADFNVLMNRWKSRLADPEILIDNIHNHINLVNTQMLLNYSPQLLAQQLEMVDSMIAELGIQDLNSVRLEIQNLIKKLDLQPTVYVDVWLRELYLAEKLIPLWIDQKNEQNPSSEMQQSARNDTINLFSTSPNTSVQTNNTANGFWDTFTEFLSTRLKNAVKLNKNVPTEKPATHIKTPVFTDQQLVLHLKNRFEFMRLSILSRNWDSLREQSTELNEWLAENLPVARENMEKQLVSMSQYKPKIVNISLAKSLHLIEKYRDKRNQVPFPKLATPTQSIDSPSASSNHSLVNSVSDTQVRTIDNTTPQATSQSLSTTETHTTSTK